MSRTVFAVQPPTRSGRLLQLLLCATPLVACGDVEPPSNAEQARAVPAVESNGTAGPGPRINAAGAAVDFKLVRPGDRISAFLGRSLPSSRIVTTLDAVGVAIDECVEDLGGAPSPRSAAEVIEHLELKGTDLHEFRSRYGYGVIQGARVQDAENAVAPSDEIIDQDLADLYGRCARAGDGIFAAAMPPVELTMRSDSLVLQQANNPEYVRLSLAWQECMIGRGFDGMSVPGPYFSIGIVENVLGNTSDGTVADRATFDELQKMELAVFEADAMCLTASGAGGLMLALEDQILQELLREFASYAPPADDPFRMNWQPRLADN